MQPASPDPPDFPTTPVRRPKDKKSSVVQQQLAAEGALAPKPQAAPDAPPAPKRTVSAKPAAPAPQSPAPVEVPCPRCEARLIDPEGMALCPACGWCRTLAEAASLTVEQARPVQRPSVLGSREFLELLRKSPGWTWIMAGGIIVAAILSAVVNWQLPPEGFVRALWTTGQIGLGVVLVLVAQTWALVLLAPQDERLGNKDLFLSGRLWGLILKRLPETQWQLAIAVWGVTLSVGAVLWIGGLSYWLPTGK